MSDYHIILSSILHGSIVVMKNYIYIRNVSRKGTPCPMIRPHTSAGDCTKHAGSYERKCTFMKNEN